MSTVIEGLRRRRFFPSITVDILTKALAFTSKLRRHHGPRKHIIIQAKNSLRFTNNEAWHKKAEDSNFDVTMGSFDGAETRGLIGSYLLSQLHPQ